MSAPRSPLWPVWRWARRHCTPLPGVLVGLAEAAGRVLDVPVYASQDLPPFDRAAMDGYLVHAHPSTGPLTVVGEAMHGTHCDTPPGPGEVLRTLTGAALPPGELAVVRQEDTRQNAQGGLELLRPVVPAQHIDRRGSDIRAGRLLFPRGHRLRPQDAALLVRLGMTQILVRRRPRVRLIASGDELVPPGTIPGPRQLPEANLWMLQNLLRRDGAEHLESRWLPDDPDILLAAMQTPGTDVLIMSGGSGPGERDYPPQLLATHGELVFHGLALQPAGSTGLGRLGNTLVCLLPGNPVSCLCAYELIVGRMLRWLGGLPGRPPHPWRYLPLGADLRSHPNALAYWRVRIEQSQVWPVTAGAASRYSSVSATDGFMLIPPSRATLCRGERVRVYRFI